MHFGAIYSVGAKGSEVRKIQSALATLGYSVTVDGVYGAATRAAVIDFQRDNGLAQDGVVGPKTWADLAPFMPANYAAGAPTSPTSSVPVSPGAAPASPTTGPPGGAKPPAAGGGFKLPAMPAFLTKKVFGVPAWMLLGGVGVLLAMSGKRR